MTGPHKARLARQGRSRISGFVALAVAFSAVEAKAGGATEPAAATIAAPSGVTETGAINPNKEPLRIASFDLSQAPGIIAGKPPAPQKPSWRTTFGSEIRNEKKRTLSTLAIDADVVLLQGLTSMREVRRLFPARYWKLVVSRQLLVSEDPLDPWSRDATASIPTTAIAIRFQRDVRVVGQDHLMELAGATGSGKQKLPAGTAVRLNVQGKPMWVVSVALAPDCIAGGTQCAAHGLLDRWRKTQMTAGEPTFAGGGMAAEIPEKTCSRQLIRGDDQELAATVVEHSIVEQHTIAGCLARLDISR